MTWFMVDDKLHGHRKIARLRPFEALSLWTAAGSWCADQLSDGFIPDYVALRITPKAEKYASALVAAGLWSEATRDGERGWQFHEWEGWQPTRADVEKKRAEARERMQRARSRSREVRANSEGTSQEVTPTPSQPIPTQPIRSSGSSSGGGSPRSRAGSSRPPRTCPKHPDGTDAPCRACADARRAHDDWKPSAHAPVTMCGEHPEHPALHCPECEAEPVASREAIARARATTRKRKAS